MRDGDDYDGVESHLGEDNSVGEVDEDDDEVDEDDEEVDDGLEVPAPGSEDNPIDVDEDEEDSSSFSSSSSDSSLGDCNSLSGSNDR